MPSRRGPQARRLFYDTLVFDAPTLRHLVATFGSTQLMIGTDYPFNFHDRTPLQRIEEAGFDETAALDLIRHNAERFLGRTRIGDGPLHCISATRL